MGRIMVSLLLTVCACVFSILSTEAAYGDWWANNRAPCTEPPCPPECPWPEDCRRNRGPQYGDWWANNRGPSHQYGHYGSFLGMGRPQFPQFGARPQFLSLGQDLSILSLGQDQCLSSLSMVLSYLSMVLSYLSMVLSYLSM